MLQFLFLMNSLHFRLTSTHGVISRELRDLATQLLQSENLQCNVFLSLYVFRTFEHSSTICVVYCNSKYSSPSLLQTSVYRWYVELNRGRSSTQDEYCQDRPKSVVVPKTVYAVRELIFKDRHVTTLGISRTSTLITQ